MHICYFFLFFFLGCYNNNLHICTEKSSPKLGQQEIVPRKIFIIAYSLGIVVKWQIWSYHAWNYLFFLLSVSFYYFPKPNTTRTKIGVKRHTCCNIFLFFIVTDYKIIICHSCVLVRVALGFLLFHASLILIRIGMFFEHQFKQFPVLFPQWLFSVSLPQHTKEAHL